MTPILVRPIREQVVHDRVIRQLSGKWRRNRNRYSVAANVGSSTEAAVKVGGQSLYPDIIVMNTEGPRRLHALIEVETTESVNHLEAMAQWSRFAKARGEFHLYVPANMSDMAQRFAKKLGINVSEIWSYYAVGEEVRFAMMYRSPSAQRAAVKRRAAAEKKTSIRRSTVKKVPPKKAVQKKAVKKKAAKKKAVKKKAVKKKAVKKKVAKKKVAKKKVVKKKVAKKKAVKKKAVKKKVVKKKVAKKKVAKKKAVKKKSGRR